MCEGAQDGIITSTIFFYMIQAQKYKLDCITDFKLRK